MAECENCIHKKVCSHRANIQTDTYAYMGIKYDTEKCEYYTTDVVPKSEVESIITLNSQLEAKVFEQRKEIERLTIELDAMRGAANSYKMHYEQAIEVQKEVYRLASEIKAELPLAYAEIANNIASEIFAEIEALLALNILVGDVFTGKYFDADLENDIAGLKKEYTEGEE